MDRRPQLIASRSPRISKLNDPFVLKSTDFATNSFVAIQDFEACPHKAARTGQNTFNSQLRLALEGITGADTAAITGAILTSYHDVVMEISNSGVVVAA